jgi:small subunit ribosomal protein S16
MIRLTRVGARKQPQYRVVVIEKERARDGRPVEVVGTYNPRTNPASIELKRERIDYWVSKGAKMSDRVSKIVAKPFPATTASVAWSRKYPEEIEMGEKTADVRLLIEQIARMLVDAPDQVSVGEIDGDTTTFELTVAPDDLGKVIGRQGRVARALRSLVSAAGIRTHKRFAIEILE